MASTVKTYTGNDTWVCPPGVTSAKVELWGAGAGGGVIANNGGGGGGGGAYACTNAVAVSAGTSYAIVVGAGGTDEVDGGDSTFASTTVVAAGGDRGLDGVGGAGGTTANSTYVDVGYAGGTGKNAHTTGDVGGGGGGGAGPHGAGNNGTAASANTLGPGGAGDAGSGGAGGNATSHDGVANALGGGGGAGGANAGHGGNGGAPGGGAGGGEVSGGEDGARGQAIITYTTPAASALTDNFDDNSINTAKWMDFETTWSAPAEANQEIEITSTTSAGNVSFYSREYYDMTGSAFFLKLVDEGNINLASFRLYMLCELDGSNNVGFKFNGGSAKKIEAIKTVATTESVVGTGVTYDPVAHLWLKIRESGGTTYWDYSANGTDWTNLTSTANPIAMTAMRAVVNTFADAEASTYVTKVDDFNLAPAASLNTKYQVSSTWKTVTGMQYRVSGVWKTVTKAQVQISGIWKSIF